LISVSRTLTRTTRSLILERQFAKEAAVRAAVRQEREVRASAFNVADEIQLRNLGKKWTVLEDRGKEVGISKFGEDAKPRKHLAEYCRLVGHNRVLPLEMLEKGADLLMKKSRGSSASTASGLWMWGHFAQDFLLYAKGR